MRARPRLAAARADRYGAEPTRPPLSPQVDNSRPDWENLAVFERGKEPARATGFPFEDRARALAGDRAASRRFLSLNGSWRFFFSPNIDGAPADFFRDDFDVSGWKNIRVPADWQAEADDQARYNNITCPFPANCPRIPHDRNPVVSYRRDVNIPADWAGQDVVLHIGAAGSAYYVWVNGVQVGYSEDSKLPSEFNVTPHLRSGPNSVSIRIYRWSDGSYLEDQDFWRVSGSSATCPDGGAQNACARFRDTGVSGQQLARRHVGYHRPYNTHYGANVRTRHAARWRSDPVAADYVRETAQAAQASLRSWLWDRSRSLPMFWPFPMSTWPSGHPEQGGAAISGRMARSPC